MTEKTTEVLSLDEITELVVEALAEVKETTVEQIVAQSSGGKREIVCDSKEGEVVVAMLEQRFGRELAGPKDLRPEQFTSVGALAALIERKLRKG